ncbi:DUF11 domain-containing protein, partial [Romboutsia sp.]|uniref:DUF11 domain-containing protein n=1 Tax=Romboutsia sp. TaxID=1965302 RepID=UPI003F2BEE1C
MANLSYATGIVGSTPSYGGIGWFDFGVFSIAPGQTFTNRTGTFKDGSTVTFNISNTSTTGGGLTFNAVAPPTFAGAAFGVTGYTGITGRVILYSSPKGGASSTLSISNIVVKNSSGVTIPDFELVTGDGENTNGLGTTAFEEIYFTTNGGLWQSFTTLPAVGGGSPPFTPVVSGYGTTVVHFLGITNTLPRVSPIITTTSPSQVDILVIEPPVATPQQAIVLGFAIQKISLNKVISNRADASDQFVLNIAGTPSASTITFGGTIGNQPVNASIFGPVGNTYTLSESMAPGSLSTLSNYKSTIAYKNISPGGTTVPASNTIPSNLTFALGDIFVATITNTVITSTLTATKIVDKTKTLPGDILTYSVGLNNTGPLAVTNAVFKDTIPVGSSFVANSVTVNGVSIPGSVAPPSGINIGTLPVGVTTVTFQIVLQTTLAVNSTIRNNVTVSGFNNLIPTNVTIPANSNTVTTTILGTSSLTSSKLSKTYANINDVITYTIPIINTGNTTAINIRFIDTIPNGTTLVAGSIRQDSTVVAGSPNPPGVTLPNPIRNSVTSTVTFQVRVITLPSPNPIPNYASMIFQYTIDNSTVPNILGSGSSNTNIANTFINRADLSNITKSTDKDFATINDVITY